MKNNIYCRGNYHEKKKTTTKGICLVLAVVLFCLFFIGCEQLGNNIDSTDSDDSDSKMPTDEPFVPNDSHGVENTNNSFVGGSFENTPSQGNDSSQNSNSAAYIDIGTVAADVMSSYAISCKLPTEYGTTNAYIPLSISFGLVEGCDADTDFFTDIILRADSSKAESIVIKIQY